jgi:protein arginine kinase activator
MLCQICKKRHAAISYTQIINHKKTKLSVCEKCAEEKGITNPLAGLPEMFGKILANIIGEEQALAKEPAETRSPRRRCKNCDTSLDDFEKTGLLGCDQCYQAFERELLLLLRRIHGSSKHIGSRPRPRRQVSSGRNVAKLRQELEQAIRREQFERAAELRDLVRDAEREASRKSTTRRGKQGRISS